VIFNRWHRHKDIENAIVELSKDVSAVRLEFASIRGKIAVTARETARETRKGRIDAEIAAIEKQLGGRAVAFTDENGVLHNVEDGD